jgi:excinuclease UvrABC nuclease subunit
MKEWDRMNARPRRQVATVSKADLPLDAGVYAFYRNDGGAYVGKTKSLSGRLWRQHLRKGASMTNSALRRNVAEELGIASAAAIKNRTYLPTSEDAKRVTAVVAAMDIAWIECKSERAAIDLEDRLKAEWMPPLTKR